MCSYFKNHKTCKQNVYGAGTITLEESKGFFSRPIRQTRAPDIEAFVTILNFIERIKIIGLLIAIDIQEIQLEVDVILISFRITI